MPAPIVWNLPERSEFRRSSPHAALIICRLLNRDQRRKYDLAKFRTWLRLSPDELEKVAEAFAKKLNKAKGPVKMLIPLKGWSSVDVFGNPTYDPNEDSVSLLESSRRC